MHCLPPCGKKKQKLARSGVAGWAQGAGHIVGFTKSTFKLNAKSSRWKMPKPLGEPGHPEYYKTETAFMALSRIINLLARNLFHALEHLLVDIFQF